MAESCLYEGYNGKNFIENHRVDFSYEAANFANVDTIVEKIQETLKNSEGRLGDLNFALSLESAKSPHTFTKNMINFVNDITKFYFGEDNQQGYLKERSIKTLDGKKLQFREKLIKALLPDTNKYNHAEIMSLFIIGDGEDIVTLEKLQQQRLDEAKRSVYGNVTIEVYDESRNNRFWRNMIKMFVINTNPLKIDGKWSFGKPRNDEDICKNIIQYQSQLYKILYDFLKNKVGNKALEGISQYMYRDNKLVSTWQNLLTVAYNYIVKMKRDMSEDKFALMLDDEIYNALSSRNSRTLDNSKSNYSFISAYLNLMYFDDFVDEIFNGQIIIDHSLSQPMIEDHGIIRYKYRRSKGNSKSVSSWNDKEVVGRDKTMSKYRQALIASIPVYNYQTGEATDSFLQTKNLIVSFTKMRSVALLIQPMKKHDIGSAIGMFKEGFSGTMSTRESLNYIFYALFETDNNKDLITFLKKNDVDNDMINALFSLYTVCYHLPRSFKNIKQYFYNNHAFRLKNETDSNATVPITDKINYVTDTYFKNLDEFDIDKLRKDENLTKNQRESAEQIYLKLKPTIKESNITPNSYEIIENNDMQQVGGINSYTYNIATILDDVLTGSVEELYLISSEDADGVVKTQTIGRTALSRELNDLKDSLNLMISDASRDHKAYVKKYKPNDSENGEFSLLIEGKQYTIKPYDENSTAHILGKYNQQAMMLCTLINDLLYKTDEGHSLKIIQQLKTSKFRKVLEDGTDLKSFLKQFMDVVKFIDDMLGTKYASDLSTLNDYLITSNNDLSALFVLAARALEIDNIYSQFQNSSADIYIHDHNLDFFKWFVDLFNENRPPYHLSILNSSSFRSYFDNKGQSPLLYLAQVNEKVIENMAKAKILTQNPLSETLVIAPDQNKYPTNTAELPGSLPSIREDIIKIKRSSDNSSMPLGALTLCDGTNDSAIEVVAVNKQCRLRNGAVLSIQKMSNGDLLWDSIHNKFIIQVAGKAGNDHGTVVYVLPMTYSDKTTPLTYGINLKKITINNMSLDDFSNKNYSATVEEALRSSMQMFYTRQWNKVIGELQAVLFDERLVSANEILSKLKKMDYLLLYKAEVDYNSKHDKKIHLKQDEHYRMSSNGKLSLNELIYEYANGYFSKEHFNKILKSQRKEFINLLITSGVEFFRKEGSLLNLAFGLCGGNVSSDYTASNHEGWFIGDQMILAKVRKKSSNKTSKVRDEVVRYSLFDEIDYDEAIGEYLELNPLIEKYFILLTFLQNLLRYILVGSEVNHEIKEYRTIETAIGQKLLEKNLITTEQLQDLTLFDIKMIIEKEQDSTKKLQIQEIYDNYISLVANSRQTALSKRNITMPATIDPYNSSGITGITKTINIACIQDLTGEVFDLKGNKASLKVHDGSVIASAFFGVLLNNSLQDNAVASILKSLLHDIDPLTGTSTLLKCAVFALTNEKIRQSTLNDDGNGVDLNRVQKKMTDIRWHKSDNANDWRDGEIDLVNGCAFRGKETGKTDKYLNPIKTGYIDFEEDILEGRAHWYQNGNEYFKIINFGKETHGSYVVYYTQEKDVYSRKYKFYHLFDKNGKHIRIKEADFKTNIDAYKQVYDGGEYHTIDSLYELYQMLGGAWSCHIEPGKGFVGDEFSVNAVVNYMNLVARPVKGKNTYLATINQDYYYQPLKHMTIDMVANTTAVKQGAGSINPRSSYFNNEPFSYITVSSRHYGFILNPDHAADLALMTEFSQVVSELDSGGTYHELATEVYQMLGRTAVEASDLEIEAWKKFKKGNDNDIYELIGKIILRNIRSRDWENGEGLNIAIMEDIVREFGMNKDHNNDNAFIPFSDPNIFTSMMSSFIANINKKSIKRQYPGIGAVISPSYDLSMIYDIGGKIYQFKDLLRQAVTNKDFYKKEEYDNITDISLKHKKIVLNYLVELLNLMITEQDKLSQKQVIEKFVPTDLVYIVVVMNDGTQSVYHLSLDHEDTYISFKKAYKDNTLNNFLVLLNIISVSNLENIKDVKFYSDVTRPRNLAPLRLQWKYIGKDDKEHYMCIFDHWRFLGLYNDVLKINQNGLLTKALRREKILEANAKWDLQKAMRQLDDGYFYLTEDDETNSNKITVNKEDIINSEAELLLSNIYASKFGLSPTDSLADIMEKRRSFTASTVQLPPANQKFYDMAFMKTNGRHVYITFNKVDELMSPVRIHDDEVYEDFVYKRQNSNGDAIEYINDIQIVSRIYAVDSGFSKTFEIGRTIIRDDMTFNANTNKFLVKQTDNKGNETWTDAKNQRGFVKIQGENGETKVAEKVYFVRHYKITVDGKKYDLYSFDREQAKRVLAFIKPTDKEELEKYNIDKDNYVKSKRNDDASKLIGQTYAKLYLAGDYAGIVANPRLSKNSLIMLKNTLVPFIREIGNNDQDLVEYINNKVYKPINEKKLDDIDQNTNEYILTFKSKDIIDYLLHSINEKRVSFQKSLYFTSARIPAQALQSFMKMKCVGFTGTNEAIAMVSHWQLWLQGSDYDIDKAYLMGLNFTDSGKYIKWSNLFDFNSILTLEASELLPYGGTKIVYDNVQDGVNINKDLNEIVDLENKISQEGGDTDENRVKRVKAYAALIRKLHNIDRLVNTTDELEHAKIFYIATENRNAVMRKINNHEFYRINRQLAIGALKNFISSRIQMIVQAPQNMIEAYTNVGMDDMRIAADESPIGQLTKHLSLWNPSTVFVMLNQNMVGKDVIAITAVASKATNAWYWVQKELLDKADTAYRAGDNNKGDRLVKLAKFDFTSNRILGRSAGKLQSKTINFLPDVDINGAILKLQEEVNKGRMDMRGKPSTASIRSQLMTAATDNAKELVLAKIKADQKYATMYALLESMGFEINDIVKFMVSPAVLLISNLTEDSFFKESNLTVWDAIKILKGDHSVLFKESKHILPDWIKDKIKTKYGEEYLQALEDGRFNEVYQVINESDRDLFVYVKKYEHIYNMINKAKQTSKANNGYTDQDDNFDKKAWDADIEEFSKIQMLSEEYNSLGIILGVNQGIKGVQWELDYFIQNINGIFARRANNIEKNDKAKWNAIGKNKREQIKVIIKEGIDIGKFFGEEQESENYRNQIIDLYEEMKGGVNPFRVITMHPQYFAMFKLMAMAMDVTSNFSIRAKLVHAVSKDLFDNGFERLEKDYYRRLIIAADNHIISQFFFSYPVYFEGSQLTVPMKKGDPIVEMNGKSTTLDNDISLDLTQDISSLASFKCFMDEKYIKMLKQGKYYKVNENGTIEEIIDNNIADNELVRALTIRKNKHGVKYYGLDFRMGNVDSSESLRRQYYTYLKATNKLHRIKINKEGTMSIADLLFLYNLIVNKNRFGGFTLTRLFSDIARDTSDNSIIKRYSKFVGDLDKNGTVNDPNNKKPALNIQVNVNDMLYEATLEHVVDRRYLSYQKDPVVLVREEDGRLVVYKKTSLYSMHKYSYTRLPEVFGETKSERQVREYNFANYFVMGGLLNALLQYNTKYLSKDANELTDESNDGQALLNEINHFYIDGIIRTYYKEC